LPDPPEREKEGGGEEIIASILSNNLRIARWIIFVACREEREPCLSLFLSLSLSLLVPRKYALESVE